jgi:hypothetical protein
MVRATSFTVLNMDQIVRVLDSIWRPLAQMLLSHKTSRGPMWEPNGMVAHTGFEPVISALRGRCPRPLDECAPAKNMAAGLGFEPRLTDPESAVLPLDDPALDF